MVSKNFLCKAAKPGVVSYRFLEGLIQFGEKAGHIRQSGTAVNTDVRTLILNLPSSNEARLPDFARLVTTFLIALGSVPIIATETIRIWTNCLPNLFSSFGVSG